MSQAQQAILAAVSRGEALKSHRDIDGRKAFRLHRSGSAWLEIDANDVRRLRECGLIDSNKKFPVATFWLTEAGRQYLSQKV